MHFMHTCFVHYFVVLDSTKHYTDLADVRVSFTSPRRETSLFNSPDPKRSGFFFLRAFGILICAPSRTGGPVSFFYRLLES
jgi:hypothetical protein